MSNEIYKLVDAVNNEIRPHLPSMSSERKRIEMRSNLMALERMARDLRRKLLAESKKIKAERRNRKNNNAVINEET